MKEVFSSITLSLFLAANASGEPLISEGGAWRYYKGSSMPPLQGGVNWTEVAYDDSTWGGPSPSGFGYGIPMMRPYSTTCRTATRRCSCARRSRSSIRG